MLTIRDFSPGDREVYLTMAHEFYHSSAVERPVPDRHFTLAFDEIMGGSPYARGLLFELGGRPAGYALLAITFSCEAGGLAVWAEEVYVRPDFRGHGVGGAFLQFLEEEYRGRAARLRLEVEDDNQRAIALYQKKGYRWLNYRQMVRDFPPPVPGEPIA